MRKSLFTNTGCEAWADQAAGWRGPRRARFATQRLHNAVYFSLNLSARWCLFFWGVDVFIDLFLCLFRNQKKVIFCFVFLGAGTAGLREVQPVKGTFNPIRKFQTKASGKRALPQPQACTMMVLLFCTCNPAASSARVTKTPTTTI